ncbi:MAG: aspartyl beta-hydroxylase [Xanthomonadaceae bacterium]|nr:aspartyl beta-hydroxylase [Xanthomonadaceae bacterium]
MSDASTTRSADPVVSHLLRLAQDAARRGDMAVAEQMCTSILAMDATQAGALQFLVTRALDVGDPQRALALATQGLENSATAKLHFLAGCALEALGEPARARDAFAQAQAVDRQSLVALLFQAAQEEALDTTDAAIRTYVRALALAEQRGQLDASGSLSKDTQQRLQHASDVVHQARRQAVAKALAPVASVHGSPALVRIEHAVDICLGDADLQWQHPLQRPTFMLIPGLEPRAWFKRRDFPFLADIEQHTAAIREELRAVLADESALSPYVDMPADAPAAPVWRDLNRSSRWSSYHLFRHGERIDAHCRRCPRTVAALESIPIMRILDHSPEVVFSLLKAGTRIPPHTGVMNGRLTVHLPLTVPADCGALNVGDEARAWAEGRCLIFDDSFVHEAWNDATEDRVVLIFDIWDPRLSSAECAAVAAAIAAIGRFNRTHGDIDATQEAH